MTTSTDSTSQTTSEAVRVGLIGYGRIGRIHAENLQALEFSGEAKLVQICDASPEFLIMARERFPQVETTSEISEVLGNRDVDAVLICSSTSTHYEISRSALQNAKHVFCEKPVDLSLEKIRELDRLSRGGVSKFQVGFNRRFDPHFSKLAEELQEGRVGLPHLVRITSRDLEPPPKEYLKNSGGLFLDMAIHDFDLVRFLLGDGIETVYATGSALVDPEIGSLGDIDTAATVLHYRSGAIVTIDHSRRAVYGYDQRVEVFGSSGVLCVSNPKETEVESWGELGELRDRPKAFFLERYEAAYKRELKEFIHTIRFNRPAAVGIQDALEATRIALAARESLESGAVVYLEKV